MKNVVKILFVVLFFFALSVNFASASVVVDGNLEWLNWNGSSVFTEDSKGDEIGVNSWGGLQAGYLEPGWGGQAFDVEILALRNEGDKIYFGLQTGFDILNGVVDDYGTHQTKGDMAFNIGDGNGWSVGLRFNDVNSYSLFQGLSDSDWLNPDSHWPETQYSPFSVVDGISSVNFNTLAVGMTVDSFGNDSYVWEGYLSAAALGLENFDYVEAWWTMACGNDYGMTTACPVPEPASLFFLATGIIGFFVRRKFF